MRTKKSDQCPSWRGSCGTLVCCAGWRRRTNRGLLWCVFSRRFHSYVTLHSQRPAVANGAQAFFNQCASVACLSLSHTCFRRTARRSLHSLSLYLGVNVPLVVATLFVLPNAERVDCDSNMRVWAWIYLLRFSTAAFVSYGTYAEQRAWAQNSGAAPDVMPTAARMSRHFRGLVKILSCCWCACCYTRKPRSLYEPWCAG